MDEANLEKILNKIKEYSYYQKGETYCKRRDAKTAIGYMGYGRTQKQHVFKLLIQYNMISIKNKKVITIKKTGDL